MGVFWILLGYLIIIDISIGNRSFKNSEKRRRIKTILSGMGTWFVLAFRSPQNGIDIKGYYSNFENLIANISFADALTQKVENYEQGYTFFNWIIAHIFPFGQLLLVACATLTIGFFSYITYKYSKDILLSYIIFICFGLYVMCFSGLRQSIAFSITFYSYRFIEKKEFLPFIITVLIAATFHSSAIVFLCVWWLKDKNIPLKKACLYLISYCLFILPFIGIIISTVSSLIFSNRYQHYQDEGGAITMFIVYAMIFIGSYLIPTKKSKHLTILRWIIFMAVICQSLGVISTGAITRIAFFFSMFFSLFIPEIFNNLKGLNRLFVKNVSIALFIVFFYLTTKDGYLNVVPYHFVWETGYLLPKY